MRLGNRVRFRVFSPNQSVIISGDTLNKQDLDHTCDMLHSQYTHNIFTTTLCKCCKNVLRLLGCCAKAVSAYFK